MTESNGINNTIYDAVSNALENKINNCNTLLPSTTGKSTYDLAVDYGYVGTERDWLSNIANDTTLVSNLYTDKRTLSEFIYKPADFMVTRRLAPPINTLQFYIDRLSLAATEAEGKVTYIETTVQDAINSTAVEGGVLADTFLTVENTINQRQVNRGFASVDELLNIVNPKDGLRVYVKSYHAGLGKGGGYFVYDSSKSALNDGGLVVDGWVREYGEYVSPEMFGAFGDGVTDDTHALVAALEFADGREVSFEAGREYVVSNLNIPYGSRLLMRGSTFVKKTAGSSYAVTVQGGIRCDTLLVKSSGSANDRALRVTGGDIDIGHLGCESGQPGSSYGIHFQSTDGTKIEGVRIGKVTVKNHDAAVLLFNTGRMRVDDISVDTYVTGVYLRDCTNSVFQTAYIKGLSPNSTGGAGNNGLLLESSKSSQSSRGLIFNDWHVRDSGEHGYRLGGFKTIRDVWFNSCRAVNTGAKGSSATGGCGFKVLGIQVTGELHKNIHFTSCNVTDASTIGDGLGNFAAFLIAAVDGCSLSNCSVSADANTYSSWHGYSLDTVKNVSLSSPIAEACKQHALRIVAHVSPDGDTSTSITENINLAGGLLGVGPTAYSAIILEGTGDAEGIIRNIYATGLTVIGGKSAVRGPEKVVDENIKFSLKHINPDKSVGPPLQNGNNLMVDFEGEFYGNYSSAAADGSTAFDPTTGIRYVRYLGAWVDVSTVRRGFYTPTVQPIGSSSIGTVSPYGDIRYSREGNQVTLFGALNITSVSTGSAAIEVSLPVASSFTKDYDAAGTVNSRQGAFEGIARAQVSTGTIMLDLRVKVARSDQLYFTVSYLVR